MSKTDKAVCPLPQAMPDVRLMTAILIALATVCILFALFTLRAFDNNRLTSWQWVFADKDVFVAGMVLLAGLALTWWFAGMRLSARNALALLLFSSFAIVVPLWNEPEVIVDSSRYFSQAKYLAIYGPAYFFREWGLEIRAWTDLPLVPLMYGFLFKFFGETRLAVQMMTTLLFSGTILFTYLIGRELWDELTGLYGGALLLGMPFLLTQVPLMLVDVPTMFFLTLAVYATLKAVNPGTLPWLLLCVVTVVLALLCKYSSWLMLSVLPVIALAYRPKGRRPLFRRGVFILSGIVFFVAASVLWKHELITEQLYLLWDYQWSGLGRWQESHVSTFLFQIHPFLSIAAAGSLYFALRKRNLRYLIIAWMVILVMVLEIKRIRYVLIAFPMLALMAAYAIRQITDARIRHYVVLSIMVSSLTITFWGHSDFLRNSSAVNIKQAGEYLNTVNASTVEVIVLPQARSTINPVVSIPLLDLFTRKRLVYLPDPGLIPALPRRIVETSSLRFSWDYKVPDYYVRDSVSADRVIAVITDSDTQALPPAVSERLEGFQMKRRFVRQEGVFRYTTIVAIYEPVRVSRDNGQPTEYRGDGNG
ncbi:MAG: glycosyltransferase family 39 protein [Gammaproteobacteria bacterium]